MKFSTLLLLCIIVLLLAACDNPPQTPLDERYINVLKDIFKD